MSGALRPVGSVDDLFRLDPIERFQALITGANFPGWLRAEPVCFDRDDPIFGYGCSIQDCGQHRTQAGLWCTGHASERLFRPGQRGIGDARLEGGRGSVSGPTGDPDGSPGRRAGSARTGMPPPAACAYATRPRGPWRGSRSRVGVRRSGVGSPGNVDLPGAGALPGAHPARPAGSWRRRCVTASQHMAARRHGRPELETAAVATAGQRRATRGSISLTGLPPLLVAEIRYGLWAHTKDAAAARWHPMWLRPWPGPVTPPG